MLWGFPHCYPVKFVRPRLPTIHPPTRQVYQSPKCGIWADTAVRKWESTKCWINILFKHTENVVVTHLFCDDDTKCLLSQFFFKHTAVSLGFKNVFRYCYSWICCTCPNHLSSFLSTNSNIEVIPSSSRISSFLILSRLVTPLINLKILISAACIFYLVLEVSDQA